MGKPMEHSVIDAQDEWPETKIPRPYPGGSYSVESLGRWIDRLMGDDRAQAEAEAHLEPLLMKDEPMGDPEPVDLPEPIPDATEIVTKGGDPEGESRG